VAVLYSLFAFAWILLSDRVARWAVQDADALATVEAWKGTGFVVVTGVALYLLVRRYVSEVERSASQMRDAYDVTLAGWAAALDIRDHSTAEHTSRVTRLTVALAERYGIAGDDLENVRRGATLHDIGKMGVPDSILGKPGALDEAEWVQMRRHPELAVDMLRGIEFLQPAIDIPWCHHERWDGSGYPRGLSGEDIPLVARLFAVVDVYDAVTSERPYRGPMSLDEAMALIEQGSGSHFDPAVVTEFVDLLAPRT
jgi:putative nucleotidyltransferase with HDIG domain